MKHRFEYVVFRVLSAVLEVFPEDVALRVGAGLGRAAGHLLRGRRAVVDENIARAFPEQKPEWRRGVADESWAHLGREAVAILRLAGLDPADLTERTDVEGLDELRAALAEGRGAVIVSGHLGSWEIGGAAVSSFGIPLLAVAKPMANRRFDADLLATRTRLGMEVVDTGAAPKRVLRALAEGRAVGIVADQNAHTSPVFVPFFGIPAATHRGPALFALRAGSPMFLGVCVRLPGATNRFRVTLQRIRVERTGDLDVDVERLTAAHTALLEEAVRRAPEQYFWQHKRWKTRP